MTRPGDILGDRWVLLEKIDAGAMGEVFRAEHQVLGHAVAVKVLLPEMTRDQGAIDRFLREARIAAKLRHPNVVRVEDYGVSSDGRPYLVMELLRGESLARLLARTPRLRPSVALALVQQIADALDTAHAAGIVHRDLKPENIFLSGPAEALKLKVLDFGVAKFTDALAAGGGATASNTLVGTPRYMSPEQARASRTLDGRSDLWALGILAYEMLTGRHPFEGEAIAELLVAILTHPIAPPSALRPALPVAIDGWCARALARNRADRFPNGHSLADALATALGESTLDTWTDASAPPRSASRDGRGTLRVRRDRTDPTPPNLDVLPAASLAGAPVDETPHRGLAALPTPEAGPRWATSWWAAIPIAFAAALGLIVVSRLATTGPAATARHTATVITSTVSPPPPVTPPPAEVAAPSPLPPSPSPSAPPVAATAAHAPLVLSPAPPAARRHPRPRSARRSRQHTTPPEHRSERRTTEGGAALYDPDGI
ncbi:MAG: serine/threonine-protein kinase [Deltaproteobacteria bacterium]|nr:serine/threonine-protein kinase [Myxococcales bacterium]MDP3217374.1 serine/threonine-protein kinase [Deltaproteobacteria bacterium]